MYKSVVEPREYYKETLTSLLQHVIAVEEGAISARYSFVNPIIASIHSGSRHRGCKSFLMQWRFRVLKQLRRQQEETCMEHEALTVMQKSLERCMLIPKSKCLLLRMRRERFASAVNERDHLAHLIQRCQSIQTCRSRTHFNQSGCLKCPVIYVKNEPMIRAIDRGNGLPVTVAIDHEMALLQKEYDDKVLYTEEMSETMHSLRIIMEKKLIYDMQAWYACRKANRASTKQYDSVTKSMFYYRIRKLVTMKNELDRLNYIIPTDEELENFEYSYSEFLFEADEYRRKLSVRRLFIEKKYSPIVWEKLTALYAIRKERQRKEANEKEILRRRQLRERQEKKRRKMLNLAEDYDDSEEAKKQRLLDKLQTMKEKRYICPHVECYKREFQSQQRLDIHLNQHRRQKLEQRKLREMHARNKSRREQEEKVFLGRLAAIRQLNFGIVSENSIEDHGTPSKLKFLNSIRKPLLESVETDNCDLVELAECYDRENQLDIPFNTECLETDIENTGDPDEYSLMSNVEEVGVEFMENDEHPKPDNENNLSEEDEDELDPYYDMKSTSNQLLYEGSENAFPKVDILDEDFMNEMDRQLLMGPNESVEKDESLSRQYSVVKVVDSVDLNDLFKCDDDICVSRRSCNSDNSSKVDEEGEENKSKDHAGSTEELDNAHESTFLLNGIHSPELSSDLNDTGLELSTVKINTASAAEGSITSNEEKEEKLDPVNREASSQQLSAPSDRGKLDETEKVSDLNENPGMAVMATGFATLKKSITAKELELDDFSAPNKEEAAANTNTRLSFSDRFKKNRIEIPQSQSELRTSHLDPQKIKEVQNRFSWLREQKHVGLIFDTIRNPMKHLELLSKHPDVECPYRIPLIPPVMRIGTLESNEVVIRLKGKIKKEGRVSKQHVVIYVPLHTTHKEPKVAALKLGRSMASKSVDSLNDSSSMYMKLNSFGGVSTDDGDEVTADENAVTIIDNHTIYGSYIVSDKGVWKVPTITSGTTQMLNSGDLVCIGVRWRGPETLSAVEASEAVMVYRVRCSADTDASNL